MINKRQLLETLKRTDLLEISKKFEIAGLTAKKREVVVDELMRVRSVSMDSILHTLPVDLLKSVCKVHEIAPASWRKDDIIKAVLGDNAVFSSRFLVFSKEKPQKQPPSTKNSKLKTENSPSAPKKVLICFGPEHAPLEQRTVEMAWREARAFKPDLLLFCAFQFDEEAAKDIDELPPSVAGMQLLKVRMNADLLPTTSVKNGQVMRASGLSVNRMLS